MQYLEEDRIAKRLLINLLMLDNPMISRKLTENNNKINGLYDNKHKKSHEIIIKTINETKTIDEKKNRIDSLRKNVIIDSLKLQASFITQKCYNNLELFENITAGLIKNNNIHALLNEAEYSAALIMYINERSISRKVSEAERSGAIRLLKIARKQFELMKTYNKNLGGNSAMGNPFVDGKNLVLPSAKPIMFNTKEYAKVIESLELIIERGFGASLSRMFSTLPDPITIEFAMKQASSALSRGVQEEVGSLINIDATKIEKDDAAKLESLPLLAFHPNVLDKNFPLRDLHHEDGVSDEVRVQAELISSKVKKAVGQMTMAIKAKVKPPKELKWAIFGKLNVVSPAGVQFMSIKGLHGEEPQKFPVVPENEQSQIDTAADIPVDTFAEEVQVETENRIKLGTVKLAELGIDKDSEIAKALKQGKEVDANGKKGWDLADDAIAGMDDSILTAIADKVIDIIKEKLKDDPDKLNIVVAEIESKKSTVGKEILQRFVHAKKYRRKGIGRYLGQKLNKIIGKAGSEKDLNIFVEDHKYKLSEAAWLIKEHVTNLQEQQS